MRSLRFAATAAIGLPTALTIGLLSGCSGSGGSTATPAAQQSTATVTASPSGS